MMIIIIIKPCKPYLSSSNDDDDIVALPINFHSLKCQNQTEIWHGLKPSWASDFSRLLFPDDSLNELVGWVRCK
jgi:hypothetical protein